VIHRYFHRPTFEPRLDTPAVALVVADVAGVIVLGIVIVVVAAVVEEQEPPKGNPLVSP
jgi:putative copper export protein